MKQSRFIRPEAIRGNYPEITNNYQTAFSDEPWYEVSKCADAEIRQRCARGMSKLAVGQMCDTCNQRLTLPAYSEQELTQRFDAIADQYPTLWYTEQTQNGMNLAALAWRASSDNIAQEKYTDSPNMKPWLQKIANDKPILWLDEVFANRNVQPRGNLANFGAMVCGFVKQLETPTVMYRTISPAMIRAAERDFGNNATIYTDTPDVARRTFITINTPGELS